MVESTPRRAANPSALPSYAFTPEGTTWRDAQAAVVQGFGELVEADAQHW